MQRLTLPSPRRSVSTLIAVVACLAAWMVAPTGPVHADDELTPVAECVIVNGDGTFTAFFGYRNSSGQTQQVSAGNSDNAVKGGSSSGTPSVFAPGRVVAAFSVTSNGTKISWVLDGRTITVTPTYTPCSTNPTVPEAPIALLLMLAPALLTGWWLHRRRPRPC